jgi:hypothetical protein
MILDVRLDSQGQSLLRFGVYAREVGSQGGHLLAKFASIEMAEWFVANLRATGGPRPLPAPKLGILQGGKL